MNKFIRSFFSILLFSLTIPSAVCAEEETSETAQTIQSEASQTVTTAATTVTKTSVTTVTETSVTVRDDKNEQYDKILQYVGTNADDLNNNLSNNAMTIDKSVIDYTDKSMYTITTRDGDIFYLIINSSDGSVFFLNSVDTSDLTSMLSDSSESKKFNDKAVKEMESSISEASTDSTSTEPEDKPQRNNNTIQSTILVIVVAAVVAGGVLYVLKIKPGRSRFNNEDFFDEETNEKIFDNISDSEEEQSYEAENSKPLSSDESDENIQPITDMYDYPDDDNEENFDV